MTIEARIIADSINRIGNRITTFELEYPRFIHAELMTHRVFSRNAASSRAIPVKRAIELIAENPAMPSHWGKNQPGMSAKEENNELFHRQFFGGFDMEGNPINEVETLTREEVWVEASKVMIDYAKWFDENKYHKQIVNRLLEPFTHIKVVLTATSFENWFWLRNHADAQPEIKILAERMQKVYDESTPVTLTPGTWHVPYYMGGQWIPDLESDKNTLVTPVEKLVDAHGNTLDDALAVSSSCAAQVSYRKLDDSLDKARDIYNRLIESMPPHFSPFEHQASPMTRGTNFGVAGVTHMDRRGNYWSGNFCGWIQHRQLIMDRLDIQHMTSSPKRN